MRIISFALVALFATLALGCATAGPSATSMDDAVAHTHFCGCDASCECKTSSATAGTCPCGKALSPKKVLRSTDDTYQICGCGGECQCNELHGSDDGSCACGKPLATFPRNAANKCACDATCGCKTQSNKAGSCSCGKALAAQ